MPNADRPFDQAQIPKVSTAEATLRSDHWMEGLIIDRAREPLLDFERRQSKRHARDSFLWYHLLRPWLLVAFWILVLGYVWKHFFYASGSLASNEVLLYLYFGIVCSIFLVMLVWAPTRGVYQKRDLGGPPQVATTAELASYATQHEKTLLAWQSAHVANIHHDEAGQMNRVDVLVDHNNPYQARLANLLGLSKVPSEPAALAIDDPQVPPPAKQTGVE